MDIGTVFVGAMIAPIIILVALGVVLAAIVVGLAIAAAALFAAGFVIYQLIRALVLAIDLLAVTVQRKRSVHSDESAVTCRTQ